ncbi:unnamed protein product [Macrosiphum euphorbiae]|uniref:MULE transposase domain-containing protein n=1 Tax=Macrosiphum euphorbiae TaxID=13131 RepID=A0AAV0W2L2_9HEMI|nr:unnamed protein product [Macrosiphum euphorbiae]
MEDDGIIQFQGKQFVFIPDNKMFVCVTTEQNLTFKTSKLCEQIIFKKLLVLKLHLDFEIGAHEAAKEVFPNIEIDACRFHLGQCWWRKINSEKELRLAYTKNSDLGKWLKLFFGIPFLPFQDIQNAFGELISICPDLYIGCLFSDYILNTYVENGCLFPPEIWAQEPSENPR